MYSFEIALALSFFVSHAGAFRDSLHGMSLSRNRAHVGEDAVAAGTDAAVFAAKAAGSGFCGTARCNGYTDADESSKRQLNFRMPSELTRNDPVSRAEVAEKLGYRGYHYGKLRDCEPVPDMFSYGSGSRHRDWAIHMQMNMRAGLWPNNPGKLQYQCAERCLLEIYDQEGDQLNPGSEPEVWVEREGHSSDLLAGIPSIGWKPSRCSVGNWLQAHWMKEKFLHEKRGESGNSGRRIMSDQDGLPVFPSPFESSLQPDFEKRFCELNEDDKASVTKRVTMHRPNPWDYYASMATSRMRSQRWFPNGFPKRCEDGWNWRTAEIWAPAKHEQVVEEESDGAEEEEEEQA